MKNGVLSKFEFPAHASGADETLVSFGLRSIRRRHNVAAGGGVTVYQVAELIAIGTISHAAWNIAEGTVKAHIAAALAKTGCYSSLKLADKFLNLTSSKDRMRDLRATESYLTTQLRATREELAILQ